MLSKLALFTFSLCLTRLSNKRLSQLKCNGYRQRFEFTDITDEKRPPSGINFSKRAHFVENTRELFIQLNIFCWSLCCISQLLQINMHHGDLLDLLNPSLMRPARFCIAYKIEPDTIYSYVTQGIRNFSSIYIFNIFHTILHKSLN